MKYTTNEILQYVQENDVKFIRLAFCDIFGELKNISIMVDELPRAFESGISFDASAVKGFMNVDESDLFLFPDPSTISILPWRPQQGRVIRFFCNIKHPDGSDFEGDGRAILKKAAQKAADMNFTCKIGTECEFYLFEADDNGQPTKIPNDRATYLDVAPADKGENVRREICLILEEMGIKPESSHHEQGPGQNEIDFQYSDTLEAADNLIVFKNVVRTVAAQNGLYASFMPKPIIDHSGNGLHINMSLSKNGFNIFNKEAENSHNAESFIAGVMNRINEICVFLNPLTNSYHRFGSCEAPKYVTWSYQNRSPLIRIPAAVGEYQRMELRSPDPACNPYLAFALLIHAGLEGIEKNLPLSPASNFDLYTQTKEKLANYAKLPETLDEAIQFGLNSSFIKEILPEKTITKFFEAKQNEWKKYEQASDKDRFEQEHYFYTT